MGEKLTPPVERTAESEEIARLRAALEQLQKAASEVKRLGATNGPQWVTMTNAIIRARVILITPMRGT